MLALLLVLTGCGGNASGQQNGGGEPVSGEIRIEGSSTVQPITQAAAELFREESPDARISVGGSGTSDGFEAFCNGDTEISDASRPIDVAEEVPVCEENGVEFIEIPIAFDGISVAVNPQNDWASDVTSDELKTMWEPAAEGKITRWSQVNSVWPNRELNLYGPGTYSYYVNNKDKLKVLAVDGVEPTTDTIRSGEYLLSRPLFIYVSKEALKNNEAVKPFVDFYLAEQNLDRIVEAARYVTFPSDLEQEARAQYEDRTTGTVFNAEGVPKGGDLEAALQKSR
jgi:phosphate transport system substrate-binding protein